MTSTTPVKPASGPVRLWLLAGLSLAGLGVSVYQTYHYYSLRSGVAGFKSFCNLGETVNCDVVTLSRFAELIGGLPLSGFAAGWYLAMLVLTLGALVPDWRRHAQRAVFAMFAFAAAFSLVYLYIMSAVIKSYCLLCLAIDVINFAGLALILSLKSQWYGGEKTERGQVGSILLTIGASVGIMLIASMGLRPEQSERLDSETMKLMADRVLQSPPVAMNLSPDLPSIGPVDAPITIVEFADFQCPGCRTAALTAGMVMNRYPGKVRLVFRNFPLDGECNKNVPSRMHPAACEAARVVTCAQRQGKFHEVFMELFDKQPQLGPEKVLSLLEVPGLDVEKIKACIAAGEADMPIARDISEAMLLQVQSTPSLFFNGHKMEGSAPPEVWEMIVDALLRSSNR